jgi:VRR-NUC domain
MGIRDRESDVLTACLQWLHWKGLFCWRQNQGAIPLKGGGYRKFVGLKGVSDILGILPETVTVAGVVGPVTFGTLLAVEVKRPGEKLRSDQAEFLKNVNDRGGIGIVVHSIHELERQLEPFLSASRRAVA